MTRYKKEIRKRLDIMLECDYDYLPYECGSMVIEGVSTSVTPDGLAIHTCYTSLIATQYIDRHFRVIDFEID